MGKIGNKLFAAVSKAAAAKKTSKKQLIMSVISLILATSVLVTATYCWFAAIRGSGFANNVNLTVGNGLRVNDIGESDHKFSDNSYLQPASSVDGRNLFFPTDGTDFSNQTGSMTFRSANAGDRNYNYVQLDFNLTAEANNTTIYLDKSTSLKIDIPEHASDAYKAAAAKAEKAIRTAIYYDGMDKPVVFTSQMNPAYSDAVMDIDRTTGRFLESGSQVAYPFKDYTYGRKQLAMLNQGETRPFSLIIWLEGTDGANCTSDTVMLKQLILNLKFTTSWDNTEEIIFEDNTENQAVKTFMDLSQNRKYTLVLEYNNEAHKIDHMQFNMQRIADENGHARWKCNIPGIALNDLTFKIIDGTNNSVYAQWTKTKGGSPTLNRGTATKYYADGFNLLNSTGYWHDGDIQDYGEGRDDATMPNDDDW